MECQYPDCLYAAELLEKWSAVIQSAPFAIAVVADDGRILECSPAWESMLGFCPLGYRYQDFTHPADLVDDEQQHLALVSGEIESYCLKKRYVTAQGRWLTVLLQVAKGNENSDSVIAFVTDISAADEKYQSKILRDRVLKGIAAGEFELRYQPIVDLHTKRTVGVEALIRWRQSDRLLSPGDFLGNLSQETIESLTFEVIALALNDLDLVEPYWIAINLDPRTLEDEQFSAQLISLLRALPCDPSAIRFEVTEQYLMNLDLVDATLRQLAEKFVVEIDDLGAVSGYSNLALLTQPFFKGVKIDKSLTDKIYHPHEGERTRRLFRALMQLAENLRLEAIVEGIETERQLLFLKANGFTLGQGYYFSKPVRAEEL